MNSPTTVEPMVRVHSHLPCVQIFILASTKLLTKLPLQNAMREASTMRQVLPNTLSMAGCLSAQNGAAGRLTTVKAMNEAKSSAPKPAHTARRSRP